MQEVDFEVELIICDDCSSDNTIQLVMDIKNNHFRGNWIKFYSHSENIGIIPNFIWALKQCRGDYIAICDGDDFWTNNYKLKNQVVFLQNNLDYSIVSHYSKVLKNNYELDYIIGKFDIDDFSRRDIVSRFLIPPSSSIFFRNTISFPKWINNLYGGDLFIVYLNSLNGRLKVLDFVGSVYRIHAFGIEKLMSKDKFQKPLRNINEFKIYHKILPSNLKYYSAKRIAWNYFYISVLSFKNLKLLRSIRSFANSLYWFVLKYLFLIIRER